MDILHSYILFLDLCFGKKISYLKLGRKKAPPQIAFLITAWKCQFSFYSFPVADTIALLLERLSWWNGQQRDKQQRKSPKSKHLDSTKEGSPGRDPFTVAVSP